MNREPKRILVVTNMYPPHDLRGGYEQSCRDVVERWKRGGHDVHILTSNMRIRGAPDPSLERERAVRRDLEIYLDGYELLSPPVRQRMQIERANQEALRRAVDEVYPDVVSVWNMGAMSFGLLATIVERQLPLVLVVCDDWLIYGPRLDGWMRLFRGRPRTARGVRRLTGIPTSIPDLGPAAVFCFVSEWIRGKARQQSGHTISTSTVVHSGIDPADFPPSIPDERPWGWRLLVVGRVEPRKGVDVAIRALAKLPSESTLEIVGHGDATYVSHQEELARRVGVSDRVRFADLPRSALRERYAAADVLLFPVLWDEPFGLVPLEAMACATPVVATRSGGSAEYLRDGSNCLVVPKNDETAIAAAVARLAGEPALRHSLVSSGLETSKRFDTDRLARVLEEWHVAAASRSASH